MSKYPDTPELDKMLAFVKSGKAGTVQDFYDWLTDQGMGLWKGRDGFGRVKEHHPNPEQLLADFFGVDRAKVEVERRAVLRHVRESA